MTSKRMTLKRIAELSGVSVTTASLFLNGKAAQYKISPSTCERIEKVMRENHFIPNFHARAIASKKTYLAGVIIPQQLETSFWLNIISGIEETLRERSYHLLLSVSRNDPKLEAESLDFMQAKGVDGIIIHPVAGSGASLQKLHQKIPVVTLNTRIDDTVPAAWNDNYAGSLDAVRYFLKNGHRKIAYIGGHPAAGRGRAYADAMKEKRLKSVFFSTPEDFMNQADSFSAVLCASDYLLLHLYQLAAQNGVRIPDDLSVCGFDGMDFIRLLNPLPATIIQSKNELGNAAASILLDLILKKKNFRSEWRCQPRFEPGQSIRPVSAK